MQFPSAASWIDEGSACSPRFVVASTEPSGPGTILHREYDFRATAYSAAHPARPVHPCEPPVEWYIFATMHHQGFFFVEYTEEGEMKRDT